MKHPEQRTESTLYRFLHPLIFGALAFTLTLFSLRLTYAGNDLAPLWFPTAIMMVGFYRHPKKRWPVILIACSLGSLLASRVLSPLSLSSLIYSVINALEALLGAVLLRRFLPDYNPLQNLQDWCKLVVASAIVPPLLGGFLVVLLVPGVQPLQTLVIWILSDSIGALALVPLGLLYKNHYLLRHRNPRLLLETLATLALTLTLSAMAMIWLPWPFTCIVVLLMWSAVRLPRMEAFAVFLLTIMMVSLMITIRPHILDSPHSLGMQNIAWLPFLTILLPVSVMTMVMYAFRLERKYIGESETRFRNAMEYSAIGMALVGTEGQWLQVNKALCTFLGYSQSELRARTFQELTWREDLASDLQQLERLIKGEIETYTMEKRYVTRSEQIVWGLLAVSLVRNSDGSPLYFIAQIEDINELKCAESVNKSLMADITLANEALFQEKERLHITLSSIGEAVICTDVDMKIIFMNPVAEKISGWMQDEAMNQPLLKVLHITFGSSGPRIRNLSADSHSRSYIEQDVILHCRSGGSYDIHYSITPLNTLERKSIGSVLIIQDVSDSRKMLRQLSYSASHDALTKLANRSSFENHLKRLLQSVHETHQHHALVFIDLDRFKAINDTAGHAAGDALLRELAGLMSGMLRSVDVLARLGGDEFGLLLPQNDLDNARIVSGRLVEAVNNYHFIWEGHSYRIGASAGIALIDENNYLASEVLSQADIACYNSKKQGRGIVSIYDYRQIERPNGANLLPSQEEQWRIVRDNPLLLMACGVASPRIPESNSFWLLSPHLQNSNGEMLNGQTLRKTLSGPTLIKALDNRIYQLFFGQWAATVSARGIGIALPLSASALSCPTLVTELVEALKASAMPPRLLYLTIAADCLMQDAVQPTLALLREAGCKIILSHLGHNLDIFEHLTAGCADYVMLDAEVISNIQHSVMDEMLVTIVQGHAQRLGLKTIAGPVDQLAMKDILSAIGIDLIYGNVISPQQPMEQMINASYFAIN